MGNNIEKNYDVIALGELLIDFTDSGVSSQGNPVFEANPGGAPCNVLALLNKMGHRTGFIGKVGDDIFGHQLKQVLDELAIDTTGLVMSKDVRTTLAFVKNDESGDRDFSFYRNPGADMMLAEDEVDEKLIQQSRIFHFGTLSMTHEGVRNATKRAIAAAKEGRLLISFDPNLREPLWNSLDEAREQVAYGLQFCDILKISDNEIQWFTGKEDFDEGIRVLQEEYQIPLILLSMGKDGSCAYYKDLRVEVQPFLQEGTIETTGAGDTFGGACLHYILENVLGQGSKDLDDAQLSENQLREMLTFANAAASIITTKKGALRVMPSKEEILALINY